MNTGSEIKTSSWAGQFTGLLAIYYCVCGIIALGLDVAYGLKTGRFEVLTTYSVTVMKWLYAVGFCSSVVSLVGHPKRMSTLVLAVVLALANGAGTAFTWYLWLSA